MPCVNYSRTKCFKNCKNNSTDGKVMSKIKVAFLLGHGILSTCGNDECNNVYRKCFIQRECVNEFICVNNCCFVSTQYVICWPSLISVCTLGCARVSVSICHCLLYFICYYFLHWIKIIFICSLLQTELWELWQF